ncbi:MAG: hypothetical protein HZB39_04820 [Planctomycetes bacterium]|nr:hypothetical protein [Planctomycetota bacterium]
MREIQPGPTEAFIGDLQPLGASSRVVVFAQDPVLGKQVFISDGTAAGTPPVTTYPVTAAPRDLRVVGTRVFLSLDDGIHGREPFVLDLRELEAGSLVTLGRACARRLKTPHVHAEGTPSLGHGDFAITLADAPSHAAAWLAIGLATRPDAAHSLCAVRHTVPFETYAVLSDALGRARVGFSIPGDPALLGVTLFADWSVADPGGPFLGSMSQTRLLQVVVGR